MWCKNFLMNFERINDCLLLSFETDIFLFKMEIRFYSLFVFHLLDYCQNVYMLFPFCYARNFKVKLVQFRYLRLQQLGCSNGTVIVKILHKFIDEISTKNHGVLWVAAN